MCYEKVVVVNGCFDVLHTGHLNLLQRARELGDYVAVLIDSDARIKRAKGANRPIHNVDERYTMLMALRNVDEVLSFDSDESLQNLLACIKPYCMVKGADYRNKPIIGSQYCGYIEYVELNGKSTTSIVNR